VAASRKEKRQLRFGNSGAGGIQAKVRVAYNGRAMAMIDRASHGENPVPGATRRILAVDYGRKRIGLALSDEWGLTAQPLETISRVNRQRDMSRLREVCRVRGVTHIIVGHPLHMTGEVSEMADEAARFAARLQRETGIGVELVDERLTSWEAKQTVAETRARRKRKTIDDVAAAILLRDYLEKARGRAHGAGAEKD
jgi:putative Holliday junction resolvase